MRSLAEAWPDRHIVQQLAAQLPWFHSCVLLDRVKVPEHREWYARRAIEHGWSRNVLVAQVETGLHKRAGKALTNFFSTLPRAQSDLAQQTLKDPYVFDFMMLAAHAQERDLERGLVEHVRDFLLELGVGFASAFAVAECQVFPPVCGARFAERVNAAGRWNSSGSCR